MFDAVDDLIVIQQVTTLHCGPSLFDCRDEICVVLQEPIDRLPDYLSCIFSRSRGEFLKVRFRFWS